MKRIAVFINVILFIPGIFIGFISECIKAGFDTGKEIHNELMSEVRK